MEREFWLQRWRDGQIGFHLERINPRLLKYWPTLSLAPDCGVLVPLCGKTLDLAWLAEQGHRTVGIELSEIAIRDFFAAGNIAFARADRHGMVEYRGDGIALLHGDFFDLQPRHLGDIEGVYDRAALVALPPETRPRYAAHLAGLLGAGARVLLVTFEYAQHEMQGPPFAVAPEEVHDLYHAQFGIERLATTADLELPARFREKGLTRMRESIYRLTRR